MEISSFDGVVEFVAAAKCKSFTGAAAQLGVTNSGVGKAVTRLEKRLGVKLLHRTTRTLTLTNEGEAYLASCERVMDDLGNTEKCLSTGWAEPRGRLRVELPAAFGRRYIVPTLIALANRHVELDLTLSFGERKVDLVADGIDLAVRIGDLADDAELVARRLGEQHLVVCASPDYLLRHGPVNGLSALMAHDCVIGWPRRQRTTWLLTTVNGQVVEQEIYVRHEMGDGETTLQSVLAGSGLGQLPLWLIRDHLRDGSLVSVLSELRATTMPIHVIWPRTRYIQPKARVVIDALTALAEEQSSIFGGGF